MKNWHLGKTKTTLKGCISEGRSNLESKLTFSESSFNFLSNRVVFFTLSPRGINYYFVSTQQWALPPTTPAVARRTETVIVEPVKVLILLFLPLSFENEQKLSKNCDFFFWTKAMLLLNPFNLGVL